MSDTTMTPDEAREVLASMHDDAARESRFYRAVAKRTGGAGPEHEAEQFEELRDALTLALAALDAVAHVRALVTAAYADGSPLIDREAIRRALDGEGA